MASDMQSTRNRENFYITFIFSQNFVRIIKLRKEIFRTRAVKEEIRVYSIFVFFNDVSSAKVTKFARFCKQRPRWEKSVIPVGVYFGDYGPLINQSERAYYCSHIIILVGYKL